MIDHIQFTNYKSIAIVSGKGGSGKTMVAASLARILDEHGKVLLIDADFGTAGLSYYLGLNTVNNISTGLTNLLGKRISPDSFYNYTQPMKGFNNSKFLPVGDHRRHVDQSGSTDLLRNFLNQVIQSPYFEEQFILVDCRGGIDSDSLAVCQAVDTIVIVAETDTTSFQATQHLVEVLNKNDLSHKIAGFMINKVFDDPSTIARAGTASFKCQYLGSIPFDLEATKRFLIGELPKRNGMFASQVSHAAYRLMPTQVDEPATPPLSLEDFRNLSIRDNNSVLGGMVLAIISLGIGSVLLMQRLDLTQLHRNEELILLQILVMTAVVSGIEPIRRIFGRAFSLYARAFKRILLKQHNR